MYCLEHIPLPDVCIAEHNWLNPESAFTTQLHWSAQTANEMSLCLLTFTVHKLSIIGTAELQDADDRAVKLQAAM